MIESWGNCPNCGAPIRGRECEYCGTMFDFKCSNHIDESDINKPILYIDGTPLNLASRCGCSMEEAADAFLRLANAGICSSNDIRRAFGTVPTFTI